MNTIRKNLNKFIALLIVVFVAIIVSLKFDYFYDLNDDLVIKDIISGAYTKTPQGHTIFMLWPFCAFISIFYRLVPGFPWYGAVMWGLSFFSLALIIYRAVSASQKSLIRIILSVLSLLLFANVLLSHFVFLHYSIISALLMSSAAFWMLTIPTDSEKKVFVKESVISIVLAVLSFCVRVNMALLMFPFFCLAGLYRICSEKKPFSRESLKKYGVIVVAVLGGISVLYGVDRLANSSKEWKTFDEYNKYEIEIFDMQIVPDYDSNKEFYDGLNISRSEFNAFNSYNFGITVDIDNKKMCRIAALADEICTNTDYLASLKYALWGYRHELFGKNSYPLNYTVIILYVAVLVAVLLGEGSIKKKLFVAFWKLGLLFAGSSLIWIYLLVKGRVPERITHSMYIVEFLILFGLLINEIRNAEADANSWVKYAHTSVCVVLVLVMALFVPGSIKAIDNKSFVQEAVNEYHKVIDGYCKARQDNFYYLDVYSAIVDGWSFDEKCFKEVDNSFKNYDFMGGWTANSPVYSDKQKSAGLKGPFEDIIGGSNVFVIVRKDRNVDWLEGFYAEKGYVVSLNTVDEINGLYDVIKVETR